MQKIGLEDGSNSDTDECRVSDFDVNLSESEADSLQSNDSASCKIRNVFFLTKIDYAKRYSEAVALPSIEMGRVAEALVGMISRVGIPSEILLEPESRVTIEVMNVVSRLLSRQPLTTIPYRTSSKSPMEKFHATLKQILCTMCAKHPNV